jgi:glycosyltransferase involved in cell wall biosynthesis
MGFQEKKKISIVTGCLNEGGIIREFHSRVTKILSEFSGYDYEIIVADNYSTDGTREILRDLAAHDPKLKVLFNSKNFGPITSGYNAFLLATGDAVVLMASDLQDPPELMAEMIRKWEEGNKIVVAVKSSSQEHSLMFLARKLFYRVLGALSENDRLISNFTGYGLYDRVFLNVLRKYRDPAPYLRGFVSEIGFRRAEIPFVQPARKHGVSKHSFLSLYDVAMSGMINHSKLPLRLATFSGFLLAGISLLIALGYLVYKLLYWKTFTLGLAPLIIGVFFFSAVQLIFIGVIGEYVGAILGQVKRRPYAVIEETLNCPNPDA